MFSPVKHTGQLVKVFWKKIRQERKTGSSWGMEIYKLINWYLNEHLTAMGS